jgi:hypothetical protein
MIVAMMVAAEEDVAVINIDETFRNPEFRTSTDASYLLIVHIMSTCLALTKELPICITSVNYIYKHIR